MGYWVYLVRCADNSLYCGIATDVERRVGEHNNSPRGARYTKSRRPVVLVYQEGPLPKGDALRRERAIKALPRKEKLLLIERVQENTL